METKILQWIEIILEVKGLGYEHTKPMLLLKTTIEETRDFEKNVKTWIKETELLEEKVSTIGNKPIQTAWSIFVEGLTISKSQRVRRILSYEEKLFPIWIVKLISNPRTSKERESSYQMFLLNLLQFLQVCEKWTWNTFNQIYGSSLLSNTINQSYSSIRLAKQDNIKTKDLSAVINRLIQDNYLKAIVTVICESNGEISNATMSHVILILNNLLENFQFGKIVRTRMIELLSDQNVREKFFWYIFSTLNRFNDKLKTDDIEG